MDRYRHRVTLVVFFSSLFILLIPNALAWNSRPEITWSQDDQGEAILKITFFFQEMSDPPAPFHHPIGFLIRYREPADAVWKELETPIQQIPSTTVFTVTAKIPGITTPRLLAIQAALDCNLHGLSDWSPEWYTATVTTTTTITSSTTVTTTSVSTTTTTSVTSVTSTTTAPPTTMTVSSTITQTVEVLGQVTYAAVAVAVVAMVAAAILATRRRRQVAE